MKKKYLIISGVGLATVGLLATAGLTNAQVSGFFDKETRDNLKQAIENKDYDTWKEIHESKPRITDYIDSEEKFEKFLEMKDLVKDGKKEEVEAIREELGLPEMLMHGRKGRSIKNQETREAIESKDYQAWLEAIPENSPIRHHIENEEDFNKLIEIHEAKKNGDYEKTKKLAEELELPARKGQRGVK